MFWDVMGGVVRRVWVRNLYFIEIVVEYNFDNKGIDYIILFYIVNDELVKKVLKK